MVVDDAERLSLLMPHPDSSQPSSRFDRFKSLRMKEKDQYVEMEDLPRDSKGSVGVVQEEDVVPGASSSSTAQPATNEQQDEITQGDASRRWFHRRTRSHSHFKVYKRRWWGLLQLALLNIVVSWDVSLLRTFPRLSTMHSMKLVNGIVFD